MDNQFVAIKIIDRSMAHGDFIVAMTQAQKQRCGIWGSWIFGNHCVIEHLPRRQDAAKHEKATGLGNRTLKVPARVVTIDEDLAKAAPLGANHEAVRVDLSLRAALGINVTEADMGAHSLVKIYPLKLGFWLSLKESISRALGRRYQLLRVTRGFLPDLEANIARARPDTLKTLGCDFTGAAIAQTIVEKPSNGQSNGPEYRLNSVRMKILPFDKREYDMRMEEEKNPSMEIFVSPCEYFAVDKDLPRLAVNEELRRKLGVATFEPVLLRRDMWRALLAESVNFGILVLLSALAISKVGGFWAVAGTIVGAVLLVVFRIRSAVK